MRPTARLLDRFAVALFLLLVFPGLARAQMCTVTAAPLDFGTYDVFAASTPILTTAIILNCTDRPFPRDLSVRVQLSDGNSGDFRNRQMRNGSADVLRYKLCIDAACTTPWGNVPGNEVIRIYDKHLAGTNLSITVYGQIDALQDVSGGPYTDHITVTILY